jgi:hypothetical protein
VGITSDSTPESLRLNGGQETTVPAEVPSHDPPMPLLKICEDCPIPFCDGCPVKNSPERYRNEERKDRWKVAGVVIAVFVVVILLGAVGALLWQTHDLVASHNTELKQIHSLAQQIASKQASHETTDQDLAGLIKGLNSDGGAVTTGTQHGLADYQAICNAIPGCHLPYPASP